MKLPHISDNDKRMLLILALFFAALGYYYFILTPLQELSGKSTMELNRKRQEIAQQQVKIRQIKTWHDYEQRLFRQVGRIYNMIEAPPRNLPEQDRIDAIMHTAAAAGVVIGNLKPMPSSVQNSDGTTTNVVYRFLIEGTGSFEGFMKLLRRIYGMKIISLDLNTHADDTSRLYFNLTLESQPPAVLSLPDLKDIKVKADFDHEYSLFSFRVRTDEHEKNTKPTSAQLEIDWRNKLTSTLSGIILQGTAEVNGKMLAIITDPQDTQSDFKTYSTGDRIRDAIVAAITDNTVKFEAVADRAITCSMKLSSAPFEPPALKTQGPPGPPVPMPTTPHLGLDVHLIDPEYAAKMKLKVNSGLMVLQSRPDINVLKGDIITQIAGKKMTSIEGARRLLSTFPVGAPVVLEIIRDGYTMKTIMKLE